jgi:hypothetical protein
MEPTAIYAKREGNLAGETVAMSVDAASMAHVMSILTDLYSDPILAVIREYSTNAWDSHVEAGVQQPIEVSLPNGLSPFFKVRDYGVGLSVEDIRNVYSKYGASTKRSTNDQVGMLGLGCKSALTYTQQFTVRSVKDGYLAHVAISRTEDGSGVMQVVHTQKTDEPNGVEISVPVHKLNEFEWKARDFFRFWEPGTVLVDGQEPEYLDGIDLGDGIKVIKSGQTDFIVMGNVGYRVSNEHSLFKDRYGYRGRNFGIVAKVDIGSVNFTPSREDLHYTDNTLKTIEVVQELVNSRIKTKAQESIDSKATHEEARQEWLEWKSMTGWGGRHSFTYKGDTIPESLEVRHQRYRPDYGRGSVSTYSSLSFNELRGCIFIHGYEKDDITPSHRAKMRLWADQKHFAGRTFVVTKEPVEQKWFTSAQVGTWEEVFATKKPREARSQVSETYTVSGPGDRYGRQKTIAELDKSKTLIVWSASDDKHEDMIGEVVRLHGNALAIRLAKNRWAKFFRENPNAIEMTKVVPEIIAKAFAGLSDDEKVSMSIDYYDRGALMVLDPKRIDDPELKRYTEVVQSIKKSDAIDHFNAVGNVCSRLGIFRPTVDKVESPKVKYPLMAAVTGYSVTVLDHFYLYANTVYAKENNV